MRSDGKKLFSRSQFLDDSDVSDQEPNFGGDTSSELQSPIGIKEEKKRRQIGSDRSFRRLKLNSSTISDRRGGKSQ
jgi:hypothetical protein